MREFNDFEIGTWAEIPSPYVTDIMSKAGFDFSIIDMEHGVIDFELAQNMIFAAHSRGKKAYVRVPEIEETWTLRCLDMGCDGLIFPHVSSEADINKIIKFSFFSPVGERGFNPYITSGGYTSVDKDYFERENDRVKIGIILEGKEAIDNIDKILAFEEIDIVYIGQYDLSMALGIPGEVNNAVLLSCMDQLLDKIKSSNKIAGCMVHSVEEAREVLAKGYKYIVYKVDSGLLYSVVSEFVKELR